MWRSSSQQSQTKRQVEEMLALVKKERKEWELLETKLVKELKKLKHTE
jgi:hypothetical protein